jgi:hypothetical protein
VNNNTIIKTDFFSLVKTLVMRLDYKSMFWFNTIIHKKMLIKLTCDLEDKIATFLDLVQQWRNF